MVKSDLQNNVILCVETSDIKVNLY